MDVTYYPTHLQSLALAGIILIALLALSKAREARLPHGGFRTRIG